MAKAESWPNHGFESRRAVHEWFGGGARTLGRRSATGRAVAYTSRRAIVSSHVR
jgi:hypothetical protein